MIFGLVNFGLGFFCTDRQTECDAYEPTVHMHSWAQKQWNFTVKESNLLEIVEIFTMNAQESHITLCEHYVISFVVFCLYG